MQNWYLWVCKYKQSFTLFPAPSAEVEPGYYRCVWSAHCAIKRRSGVQAEERVLCGEEQNMGHTPQTSSVSLLDHTLMRHLCESWASVRPSMTLVPPVTGLNNNNNLLKMPLAPNQKCCFPLTTVLSCQCVYGHQVPFEQLYTVGEGYCKKGRLSSGQFYSFTVTVW